MIMCYHWGLGVGHHYTRTSWLNTKISATAEQLIDEHTGDLCSILDTCTGSGPQPLPLAGLSPNVCESTLDGGEMTTRLRGPHQGTMTGGPSTTLNPERVNPTRNLDLLMQEANNVSHTGETDHQERDLGDKSHNEQQGTSNLQMTLGGLQQESATELEVLPASTTSRPHQEVSNTLENAEQMHVHQSNIEIEGDCTGINLGDEDFELGCNGDINSLGDDSDPGPSVAYLNTFDATEEDLEFLEDMYGDDVFYDTNMFSYD